MTANTFSKAVADGAQLRFRRSSSEVKYVGEAPDGKLIFARKLANGSWKATSRLANGRIIGSDRLHDYDVLLKEEVRREELLPPGTIVSMRLVPVDLMDSAYAVWRMKPGAPRFKTITKHTHGESISKHTADCWPPRVYLSDPVIVWPPELRGMVA